MILKHHLRPKTRSSYLSFHASLLLLALLFYGPLRLSRLMRPSSVPSRGRSTQVDHLLMACRQ